MAVTKGLGQVIPRLPLQTKRPHGWPPGRFSGAGVYPVVIDFQTHGVARYGKVKPQGNVASLALVGNRTEAIRRHTGNVLIAIPSNA